MMRPDIDGRLAQRIRDIAALEADTHIDLGREQGLFAASEKRRILEIAADLLEDYIMDKRAATMGGSDE